MENIKDKDEVSGTGKGDMYHNKVEAIKIVQKDYLEEGLLTEFYDYLKENSIRVTKVPEEADIIVSLGGDGTILLAAKEALLRDIPIMAVNMGTLGYLSDISLPDVIEMLERYRRNKHVEDERVLLEVDYNGQKFHALNEMLISKGGLISQLIEIEVYDNGIFVNKYRADGIIVATPTGSTAYSLSAGGSIVHPSLRALIITPLLPQTMTARPIIIDGNRSLSFKVSSRDNDIHMNIDGRTCFRISSDDDIKAMMSEKKVRIIKSGKRSYYEVLRKKLGWGMSTVK